MKLKRLNPNTIPSSRGYSRNQLPRVAFETTGVISFNQKAQQLLDIKAGDTIELLRDEESGNGNYLTKSQDGFILRLKGDKKSLCFTCSALKHDVFASVKYEGRSYSFKIKPEPIKQKGFPNPLFEIDTVII